MIKPQIHIPYEKLDKYISYAREERYNLEIYFGSRHFDSLTSAEISFLENSLDYEPVITVHAPFMDLSPGAVDPRVREITYKRFSDVIEYADILNAEVIVFHSGYEKWKYDGRVDIWLDGSLQTWRPLNKKAEGLGIKIAIENIFEDEPGNLRLLMDEINSKNFGVCFDTGHFNIFSKISLLAWLEKIKPFILELHLHDNNMTGDDHLPIGDGNFDFKTLFKELKGKNCVYTLEAHSIEDTKKSLEKLKSLLNTR